MKPILELDRLRKSFGGLCAVNNLSFSVQAGEILGFIGPNGAGKTTAFNLIMGVYRPDAGRILFKGRDISGWPTYKIVNLGIARTFQIARPFHHKTVVKNVEISTIENALFARENRAARWEASCLCCDRVGLADDVDKLPGALPHAGLRRLEVAKALGTEPDLVLFDEPFAGLSIAEVEEMSELIRKLPGEGRTVVIVDHNMRGLMRLVDRVVVIHFGEKLAEGAPEAVAQNPLVQEAYLAGGGMA
ncbi:ABC transporter ATP-binding protein [Candidatus Acetothermia bacterium]|nr:ABC transporter ATP-binding protein [Candidatus Acetothermia bacterium]